MNEMDFAIPLGGTTSSSDWPAKEINRKWARHQSFSSSCHCVSLALFLASSLIDSEVKIRNALTAAEQPEEAAAI